MSMRVCCAHVRVHDPEGGVRLTSTLHDITSREINSSPPNLLLYLIAV